MGRQVYSVLIQSDGENISNRPLFSAGTILLFMLTGIRRKIPERFSNPHLMEWISGYCANLGISNEAIDLLNQILRLDSTTRLTLRQICAHPWVTQHTWNLSQFEEIRSFSMNKWRGQMRIAPRSRESGMNVTHKRWDHEGGTPPPAAFVNTAMAIPAF